jgi:hypothetical protein
VDGLPITVHNDDKVNVGLAEEEQRVMERVIRVQIDLLYLDVICRSREAEVANAVGDVRGQADGLKLIHSA